jgi:hypothetical protein
MSNYKNTYKPTAGNLDVSGIMSISPEDYDFNFVFDVRKLQTDRVELRPFVVGLTTYIRS